VINSVWHSVTEKPLKCTTVMVELENGAMRLAWFGCVWFHNTREGYVNGGLPVVRWRLWSPSP
jgi:hypothetical protein